jgi:hypothetical protein
MVPCGGANSEGWIAFRDALARIEAYTCPASSPHVRAGHVACSILLLLFSLHVFQSLRTRYV